MLELNINTVNQIYGGEVGATGMGDNRSYAGQYPDGKPCADTIMAWGGMGGVLGGVFGGLGGLAGTLGGGWLATKFATKCR